MGGYVVTLLFFQPVATAQITSTVVERGQNHQVVQNIIPLIDLESRAIIGYKTNHYTHLEIGMHYWDGTGWAESQALIEPHPEGAVADKGIYKVIFSPTINVEGAIDLLTPDDKRLRFHPLALRWANKFSGERILVAEIQHSQGEILPPAQVIYRDCFRGIRADMIYTYGKGVFEADVVLRENPPLPGGWLPEHTRLEMVTEFIDPPNPELKLHIQKREEDVLARGLYQEPDLIDCSVFFGESRLLLGHGFQDRDQLTEAVPVAKQWLNSPEGRVFLIETLDYSDIRPYLETLEAAAPGDNKVAGNRSLPVLQKATLPKKPIALASSEPAEPGFVIDFQCLTSTMYNFVFEKEKTYCIDGAVSMEVHTEFREGAVIKFHLNAILKIYDEVVFPSTSYQAVFTAKDDHDVGVWIDDDGDGILEKMQTDYYADAELYLVYADSSQVENLQFRYSGYGVFVYSPGENHTVRDCRFRKCETGVGMYQASVVMDDLQVCELVQDYEDFGGSSYLVGDITPYCDLLVNDPSHDTGTDEQEHRQRESTIIVNGSLVLIAYNDEGDTNAVIHSGFARSTDYGATFTDKGPVPHAGGTEPTNYEGDHADTVLAYDKNNNYSYLTALRWSGKHKLNFFRSNNYGADFLHGIDPNTGEGINSAPGFSTGIELDKPWIVVDNFDGAEQGTIYQVFKAVNDGLYFSRSTDFGDTWDDGNTLNQCYKFESVVSGQVAIPYVTVASNHDVYIFYYLESSPNLIKGKRSTDQGASWSALASISLNGPGNYGPYGTYFLDIKKDYTVSDVIRNVCHLHAAIHPITGTIYLVYPDEGSLYPSVDQSDIFLVYSTNNGASWSSPVRVNDDDSSHDQWNPVVSIQPDGSDLFVGFYDRRLNSTNTFFHTFGTIADVSGNPPVFGPNFQISEVGSRPELYLGPGVDTATDYDQAVADNDYFYYAWTDERRIMYNGAFYIRQLDIRFSRIED